MLTIGHAFYDLSKRLQPLYDEREAAAIAHEVLNTITGLDRSRRLMQKEVLFSAAQQQQFNDACTGLLQGRPLQYVLGTAWFMGRPFLVNEAVLIPRPETEELVDWIIKDKPAAGAAMLDVGTGSGCIPVSLKLALPMAVLTACDISSAALAVAASNARSLSAAVQFLELDFLDLAKQQLLGSYDIIVSNPPYIPHRDRAAIHTNVKDHEPGIALFVPDDDALLFYRAIATFGTQHLNSNGYIYCELDAAHAAKCKALFESAGYKDVILKQDMNANWRMLRATHA